MCRRDPKIPWLRGNLKHMILWSRWKFLLNLLLPTLVPVGSDRNLLQEHEHQFEQKSDDQLCFAENIRCLVTIRELEQEALLYGNSGPISVSRQNLEKYVTETTETIEDEEHRASEQSRDILEVWLNLSCKAMYYPVTARLYRVHLLRRERQWSAFNSRKWIDRRRTKSQTRKTIRVLHDSEPDGRWKLRGGNFMRLDQERSVPYKNIWKLIRKQYIGASWNSLKRKDCCFTRQGRM